MKLKNLSSVILAAMMAATSVPAASLIAPYNNLSAYAVETAEPEEEAPIAWGMCGENLTWEVFAEEDSLVIDGTGAMTEWESAEDAPWAEYGDRISLIVIRENVESISENAFGATRGRVFFFNSYDCVIPDNETFLPENASIYGYDGSTAQAYAEKYGREFTSEGKYEAPSDENISSDINDSTDEDDSTVIESDRIVAEGICGENLKWEIDSLEDILIISGYGEMTNWEKPEDAPWFEYSDEFDIVIIRPGVGELSEYSLGSNVKIVYLTSYNCVIPDSETAIPADATILGYSNSTAQAYAEKYNREFDKLNEENEEYPLMEGNCTENLEWILWNDGSLAFYGYGDIVAENGVYPWDIVADSVKEITISTAVKSIGENAFTNCTNLESVMMYTPDCKIADSADVFPSDAMLCVGDGSTAEEYAVKYNLTHDVYNYFTASGKIGDNLSWILFNGGSLRIYGEGDMIDLGGVSPWAEYEEIITRVQINDEVTSVDKAAFEGCDNIAEMIVLNPECKFAESEEAIPEDVVIFGAEGSGALMYAQMFGRNFKTLSLEITTPEEEEESYIAYGELGDNLYWTLDDGKLNIKGSGDMIEIDGVYPWDEYADQIKTVFVNENVTSISTGAFDDCKNIKDVWVFNIDCVIADVDNVFPANAEIYGYNGSTTQTYAEKYNKNFVALMRTVAEGELGENLSWSIDEGGVININGIGDMIEIDGVYPWDEYADQITTVNVFDDVTSISAGAFDDCANIQDVWVFNIDCVIADVDNVFPANAEIYGYNGSAAQAHAEKYGLDFVEIASEEQEIVAEGVCGENLTWVLDDNGSLVFSGEGDMNNWASAEDTPWAEYTSMIRTVSMSEEITSIGDYAFYGCENLVTGALTSVIGAHAYEGCKRMNGYSYYGDVSPINEIKDCAFKGCYTLWAIPIANPDCIIADSEDVFDNNTTIMGYAGSTAQKYAEKYERDFQDITLIDAEGSCGQNLNWYMTSDGMLGIGGSGEMDNYSEDITAAPWYSFAEDITSICINDFNLDDEAISLSENCFAMCENAETIHFYNSSCIIADSAETIPENAVIWGYAGSTAQEYAEKYNREFEAIPTIEINGALNDEYTWELNSEGILYITGFGAMDDYTDGNPWGEYADMITSVYFYGNVTSIGKNAFSYCENLEFVDIDESIEFIDMDAFIGCNNLIELNFHGNKKCVIYDSVSTIPAQAELIGHYGSPLHEYAKKYDRTFYWIDGDVNGDSTVDSSDASMVLAEYANIQTGGEANFSSTETTTADVTNDEIVDAADASAILRYYSKASTGGKPTWD